MTAVASEPGRFAAVDGGTRWTFEGALTMDTAAHALAFARSMPLPSTGVVDFAHITHADSAALAVMIALKRRGSAEGRPIELAGLPATLSSLAVVYGVESLLGN